MTATFINEYFYAYAVTPELLDQLLARGWRHFGVYFYRYSQDNYGGQERRVLPVRVHLPTFKHSKTQRRVWRKNADLRYQVRPALLDHTKHELFARHKLRFTHNIPDTIYEFLSEEPASIPTECREICVYDEEKLVAASFLDIGEKSVSTIYGMFAPEYNARSLGLYTMLCEIEYAQKLGINYYYHGYCHEVPSFYDYKKRFSGLQRLDWKTETWQEWKASNYD